LLKVGQLNHHTFLFGVALRKTHLLDLALAGCKLSFADDHSERYAVDLCGLELLRQLRLDFPAELGLDASVL
jgi:hypothetical protein